MPYNLMLTFTSMINICGGHGVDWPMQAFFCGALPCIDKGERMTNCIAAFSS